MKVTAVLLLLLLAGGTPLVLATPTVGSFFLCHFAHLSARHLFFSGSTALLLTAALERRLGSGPTALLLGALVVSVSAAVLAFEGELLDYQGASGLGYGLAAALAARQERRIAWPLLLVLAIKIGFEFATGRCLVDVSLQAAGAQPVPVAHAAGAAAGVASQLFWCRWGGRLARPSGDQWAGETPTPPIGAAYSRYVSGSIACRLRSRWKACRSMPDSRAASEMFPPERASTSFK